MELCDVAITAFETALRRPARGHEQLVERGAVEMIGVEMIDGKDRCD